MFIKPVLLVSGVAFISNGVSQQSTLSFAIGGFLLGVYQAITENRIQIKITREGVEVKR